MLPGAFATRALIEDRPPTQDFLTSYVDAVVLPALCAHVPSPAR